MRDGLSTLIDHVVLGFTVGMVLAIVVIEVFGG
jgi:hypothetical protein